LSPAIIPREKDVLTDLVTLRSGTTGLTLAPSTGGAIARFWSDTNDRSIEWLRPATAAALTSRNPLNMSCFPLAPYSGRICGGRFTFQGREVVLPLNFLPESHSIHGHAWLMPWKVIHADDTLAALEYHHKADDWPWSYRTSQDFVLEPGRLTLEMSLTNEGPGPMPAGLGPHPYFVRTPKATVAAGIGQMWLDDGVSMPIKPVDPPPERNLAKGVRTAAVALDNCFSGWDRKALIEWPEWMARLTMTADSPLDFLVVYTPPKQDFFCVEPVSHAPDAVNNLAAGRADTGLHILEQGRTMRVTVRFETELL
jgi:aldose 1-epimerase